MFGRSTKWPPDDSDVETLKRDLMSIVWDYRNMPHDPIEECLIVALVNYYVSLPPEVKIKCKNLLSKILAGKRPERVSKWDETRLYCAAELLAGYIPKIKDDSTFYFLK